jgi:hypothetical protein
LGIVLILVSHTWEARKHPFGCEQWGRFCCLESRKRADQKKPCDSIQWDIENSLCPPKLDNLYPV